MVKIMNEVSLGDGAPLDSSTLRDLSSNMHMSSTRQIVDVSHKTLFSCCSIPVLIEMNLIDGPVYERGKKFEAALNFISGNFKKVQAIKLALIVHIEIRDLNKKLIESKESEVLSSTKMKPFTKKESLSIDIKNYKEIVDEAKNEFKLL